MISSNIDSDIFAYVILAASVVLFSIVCRRNKDLLIVVFVALTLRFIAATLHFYFFSLPDSQFDALNFQAWALLGAQSGLDGALSNFTTGAYMYPSLVSFVFLITGPSELVMQSINVSIGTGTVILLYNACRHQFDHLASIRASLLFAILPPMVLYSAITMREVEVIALIVLSIDRLILWRSRKALRYGLQSLLWAVAGMLFHTGMAILVLMLGLILVFHGLTAAMRFHRSLNWIRYIPIGIVAAGIATVIVFTGAGLEKFGGDLGAVTIDALALQQEYVSRSRASYLDTLIVSGWEDLALHAPLRMLYFIAAPFPWMISNTADLVGALDGLFYVAIIFVMFLDRKNILLSSRRKHVLVVFIGCVYLFSFVTSNYGTALRHRAKLLPIAIVLVCPMLVSRRRRVERYNFDESVEKGKTT